MKFYAEIQHPHEDKVLWHYFLEAPNKTLAEDGIRDQVVKEHSKGFLLDTDGLFELIIEEDSEEEYKLNLEKIAEMSDDEVYHLSTITPPRDSEEKGFRLSHRRFENEEDMEKCMDLLKTRLRKIIEKENQ